MWIDAAKADMRRCGVHDSLLVEETMSSLAKSAVVCFVCFVKGQYGYDNSEAPRFLESYRMMLAGLLNSKANEYLFPDTPTPPSDDAGGDGGEGEQAGDETPAPPEGGDG